MRREFSLIEVGPRDGLQNESVLMGTAQKVDLVARMLDAGVKRIEVASFVHPKRVPQMADAEAVIAGLPDRSDVSYIGLCLNKRGVMRAIETRSGGKRGVDETGSVLVMTDTFGKKNQGQTVSEGIVENGEMIRLARSEGLKPQITLSAAFGCPFEGEVDPARVVEAAKRVAEFEPDEIALADTIGVAVPAQVSDLVGRISDAVPNIPLRVHFHNTRNTGLANVWAAVEVGVTRIDASVAGMGGCPFAPAATGNVPTEDVLYMLHRAGWHSGIDLAQVSDTALWLTERMGRQLPGMVSRAGGFPASEQLQETA
ncbi:MAG: hydroxymethylglutaryl-CoA lyase [Hyphomonadaceae bacterium]